jgi:hypothetical protein
VIFVDIEAKLRLEIPTRSVINDGENDLLEPGCPEPNFGGPLNICF